MSDQRLARPLYEALPWCYLLCGIAALTASYLTRGLMSAVLGVPGLVATIGGIVVLLRRRDYRRMRADYLETDSSVLPKRKE
jgi:nitrate reductase gamma subunit